MAVEYPVFTEPGLVAASDMSVNAYGYQGTAQFLFCKITADFTVDVCAAITDRPNGIIQNDPIAGDGVQVQRIGWSKGVAGGTLTAGEEVTTDVHGRVVAVKSAATGRATGSFVMGTVVGSANIGELATINLCDPYQIY